MSILQKLLQIQQQAVAPKDKPNEFAGYKYRNVEGILRQVKPIFKRQQVYCQLSDEIVEVNGAAYVKATATLFDIETGESVSSHGWAREAESKKGNDSSQCTGSASTYARKYALCGLLGLDDSKAKAVEDPDSVTPMEHDDDKNEQRGKILADIYALDVTRKELDTMISSYYKGKDADSIDIVKLKAVLNYYKKTKGANK